MGISKTENEPRETEMIQITINSPEWTTAELTAGFAEGETPEIGAEAADAMVAWLVLHTHETLPGWAFTAAGFTGTARADAVEKILSLISDATDYVIEHMDEIRADVAEDAKS